MNNIMPSSIDERHIYEAPVLLFLAKYVGKRSELRQPLHIILVFGKSYLAPLTPMSESVACLPGGETGAPFVQCTNDNKSPPTCFT